MTAPGNPHIKLPLVKLPLRVVLVGTFLLPIFLAVGLTGSVALRNGQESVGKLVNRFGHEEVSRIGEKLDSYLTVPRVINQSNVDGLELGTLNLSNRPQLQQYLWRQIRQFEQVTTIGVGLENGDYLGMKVEQGTSGDERQINLQVAGQQTGGKLLTYRLDGRGKVQTLRQSLPNYDPRQRPWYRQAVQAGHFIWGPIYSQFSDRQQAISGSQPFYDGNGKLLGVVNTDLSLAQLTQFLQDLPKSYPEDSFVPRGMALILDQAGKLVAAAHHDPTRQTSALPGQSSDPFLQTTIQQLSSPKAGFESETLKFNFQGQQQFLIVLPFQPQPGLNWLIALVIPEANALELVQRNLHTTLLTFLFSLCLSILLGLYISRWISYPILQLNRAAEAIARSATAQTHPNGFDQPVKVQGIRELEVLAHSFNQMARQLQSAFTSLRTVNEQLEQRVARRTAALRQAEAELRGILAAMTELILVFDTQERLLEIVPTSTDQENQPPASLLHKPLPTVLPSPQVEAIRASMRQAIALEQTCTVDYSLVVGDREVWYSACISPINGDSVIFVARDITEQHRAEEELARTLEKEKQLNELKSRFVSMTSHEFRTPLTTILSSTELLQSHSYKWGEPRDLKHLERIHTAVERMTELLNGVLVLSRAEAGRLEFHPQPLNLEQFCRDLVEDLQSSAPEHQLLFSLTGNCTQVAMDEKLLQHILPNLLSNAIKYSPRGGSVRFEVTCTNTSVCFQIQDQGIGIPTADLPHLFESFHRAKNVGNISGTGLGLAIVKKSVDLHGGTISVTSEVGIGTTFIVILPLQLTVQSMEI